ncbi:MAG: hypothetical protein OHK0040_11520 [bacterium]
MENQKVEYKSTWQDSHLKTIAAFAKIFTMNLKRQRLSKMGNKWAIIGQKRRELK